MNAFLEKRMKPISDWIAVDRSGVCFGTSLPCRLVLGSDQTIGCSQFVAFGSGVATDTSFVGSVRVAGGQRLGTKAKHLCSLESDSSKGKGSVESVGRPAIARHR